LDEELDLLLGTVINSMTRLNLLLYLTERPGEAQSPKDIAAALRRPEALVAQSLAALAQVGLVDQFVLGSGRFIMYGAAEEAHVKEVLARLISLYAGDARSTIVRRVMRLGPGDTRSD
jgi:predicted transcriptional regulator